MERSATDCIVAPATGVGRAALALVRVSGAGLDRIWPAVVRPHAPELAPDRPRRVDVVHQGTVIDDGIAVLRRGPGTATGEDLLEVSVHGNPLIVTLTVEAFLEAGARLAQPGEFTRRAVLHGRLDLVAAEAVDQVVRATTPGGLRLGREGLTGALGERLGAIRARLVEAAAELEARLDYPGDELALRDDSELGEELESVAQACEALAATYTAGRALVDGVRVALVGEVNAGKSSLFNRLLGRERALVAESPGTTRDVVEARCQVGPMEVTLWDTAGERATDDPVEAAGLALARDLVEGADVVLLVLKAAPDTPSAIERELLERTSNHVRVVAYNGIDRPGVARVPPGAVGTSARTGRGLDALRDAVVAAVGVGTAADAVVASTRQRDRLQEIAAASREALRALPISGVAVAAACATDGLAALDELTGADTREDVLDAVFRRFCIGK